MQQAGMPCGIRHVDPADQDGQGDALHAERCAVRRAVDAVSAARHHRHLPFGQTRGQVGGHMLAAAGKNPAYVPVPR